MFCILTLLMALQSGIISTTDKESDFKFVKDLRKYFTYIITTKSVGPETRLICRTNQNAQFSWQECKMSYGEIADYHLPCHVMAKEPSKYCREIMSNHSQFYVQKFESQVKSELGMRTIPSIPQRGCLRCIAKRAGANPSRTIISNFSKYYFKDECNTPTIEETRSCNVKKVLDFSRNKTFADRCRVAPVTEINAVQNLTEDGELDITITWPKAYCTAKQCPYGYIVQLFSGDTIASSQCFYTGTEKKANYSFSLSRIEKLHFAYTYNVHLITLPSSEPFKYSIPHRQASDLCHDYFDQYHHIPERCHIVRNVTQSPCSAERTIKISWERRILPGRLDDNYTYVSIDYGKEIALPLQTTSFTVKNVNKSMIFQIYLKPYEKTKENNFYQHTMKIETCEKPVELKDEEKTGQQNKYIIISTIGTLIFVTFAAFLLFLYFGMRKLKIPVVRQRSEAPLLDSEQREEQPRSVMLVYAHGCVEVENLVLFLAGQLNEFGINVLTDNLQAVRVAKHGFPTVLIQDFKDSDYVIVLCTESETTDLPCHRPYTFVLNQLISADCVYQNSNRYLAVYFTKKSNNLPPYLVSRAYYLPSSFENFVQHLLGYQTFLSSVFQKIFQVNDNMVTERKNELRMLVSALNMTEHRKCNSSTCRKGTKVEDDECEYPTLEILQKEVEKHQLKEIDKCSLRFSSTESSICDEKKPDETVMENEKVCEDRV